MKSWRQWSALLLALAWMPMVHSCEIAHALGIELPQQGERRASEPAPADDCDHCHFCETLHAGGMMAPTVVIKVSVPNFAALIPTEPLISTRPMVELLPAITAVLRSDQGDPPQRWQFVERTALPPRAPSFCS